MRVKPDEYPEYGEQEYGSRYYNGYFDEELINEELDAIPFSTDEDDYIQSNDESYRRIPYFGDY